MPLMPDPDEDRFIRGIAAAPEDEALRLVYSDWLEEQGDLARATYLRKEARHFRDPERGPAADGWPWVTGCDPVWLAMVSRLPFGILIPGLTFSDGGPPATWEEVRAIEAHWGRSLPADYAAFLLLFNGGTPSKEFLAWQSEQSNDAISLFSTKCKGVHSEVFRFVPDRVAHLFQTVPEAEGWTDILVPLGRYARTIPIGYLETSFDSHSGQQVVIGLDLDNADQRIIVLGWQHVDEDWFIDQRFSITTFTQLLADLIEPPHGAGEPYDPA